MLRWGFIRSLGIVFGLAGFAVSQEIPRTAPPAGLRDKTPTVHAFQGGRIVVSPEKVLEKANLVIRNGRIEAVGADLAIPDGAQVHDVRGKTLYPGLIDAYSEQTIEGGAAGAGYWNQLVTPQLEVSDRYQPDSGKNEKLRGLGITARLVAPSQGILKGFSAVVSTADGGTYQTILKPHVAQHVRLTVPPGRGPDQYPASPMGAVALARQAMYDAQWYRQAWTAYRANRELARPEQNTSLDALETHLAAQGLFVADVSNEWYFLRAHQFAREFSLKLVVRGSGREYRRLDAIRATAHAVITPVNFPKPPNVNSTEAALGTSLEDLMHWDLAPENPARLAKAGIRQAFTAHGLKDPADFLKNLRKAVRRGLPANTALAGVTSVPAELLGMSDQLGTLETGKLAHLVVTNGDLWDADTKILETWVDGKRHEIVRDPSVDVRGVWSLSTLASKPQRWIVELKGTAAQPQGTLRSDKPESEDEKQTKLEHLAVREGRLSFTFAAKEYSKQEGVAQLTVVMVAGDDKSASWTGELVWPDGSSTTVRAERKKGPPDKDEEEPNKKDSKSRKDEKGSDEEKDAEKEEPSKDAGPALFEVNYPLGPFGREDAPEQAKAVLFKNATIWTSGPEGILDKGDLLIGEGKIVAIGRDLETPAGAIVVDCQGKHISAGIIDCHSHMGTDGGINEATQSITAEVRIGDFINANDIDIYRQLAAGVTTSNVLHGSANSIGGQNQVIKLRWGALPEELKFQDAPPGIKFALGENVKQSNWSRVSGSRYPQSRMGVEQLMRDAFQAAREYSDRWETWQRTHQGPPPRRDLELDALSEVLQRKRWIHCHSYRQDEILAFLRVLEDFDIQVGTLQHILEGYKVADAMAKHGAMASSFTDWWGYKFEVLDAIPYNAALMNRAGVVVSFNSDDRQLARTLNQEAAKAVKYGGIPPAEAIKFVTINPARQLRIDAWVGSLEPGKHADIAVWSGSPLSTLSRCEQTWIDGRRYFSRDEDRAAREQVRERRAKLIQKVLKSGEKMRTPEEDAELQEEHWATEDDFCHAAHPHF